MIVAVDFDGTCVKFAFPEVGADIGAAPVLRDLVAQGHKIILWTVRDNKITPSWGSPSGEDNTMRAYLHEAVQWFKDNEIPLWGINRNPQQATWSVSPKCHADIFIDDMALGCPLMRDSSGKRRYVNWRKVRYLLVQRGFLPCK